MTRYYQYYSKTQPTRPPSLLLFALISHNPLRDREKVYIYHDEDFEFLRNFYEIQAKLTYKR